MSGGLNKKGGVLGDPQTAITRGGKGSEEKFRRAVKILLVLFALLLAAAIWYGKATDIKTLQQRSPESSPRNLNNAPADAYSDAELQEPVKLMPVKPETPVVESVDQINKRIAELKQKIQDQKESITALETSAVSDAGKRSNLMLKEASLEAIKEYEREIRELEIKIMKLESGQ